ncbi:MAG TPA: maleylpyruvate isomerase family mycothiol-dependent enzyme [Actinomycetota bacterium]|nr:maleylpyruvate isomerase family mycothiol-dependent enzyme [Actinomycetota bacterium]
MVVEQTREVRVSDLRPLDTEEAERISNEMSRALVQLLKELDVSEWDSPTDCDRWTVRDHVSHQIGWNEALISTRELFHQMSSAAGRVKEIGNIIDAQNQVQVDERRHLEPPQAIACLEETFPRGAAKRKRLSSILGRVPIYSAYLGGWMKVEYLAAAIFPRDIYMHRVDIAQATGREVKIGPAETRLIDDIVRDWFARTKTAVRLELTGPAARSYVSDNAPLATLRVDAVQFTRVLFGRADRSIIEIEGDRTIADRALDTFFPV